MSKKSIPKKIEVLIVGAGPAGSTLAYELARLGIGVLLLDKANFPRGKTCAGGINVRTLRFLPFDLGPVVERVITGISFTRNLEKHFLRRYHEPLMVTVRREVLDNFLAQKAIQMGACFADGTQFFSLRQEGVNVQVETSAGACCAQFVIGADGAQSIVAMNLELMTTTPYMLAIHSEVPTSLFPWAEPDLIHLDWGSLKRSYAYLFPKKDFFAMGAGGFKIPPPQIKNYQRAFGYTKWQKEETPPYSAAGFLLPLRQKRSLIHQGRCLLLGDAAGLIDPFNGEGISYAIRGAQLAAPLLAEAVKERRDSLQSCQEAINRNLMPEIECSRLLREIFNLCPSFFHRKLANSDRWWVAMAKIMRGEKTLVDIKNKLGPLGSLLLRMAR
ncbi:MAG: geranylgeranyl reductase family protein [Deltaproteobacteria bacterium]|nr:geranylgeranyl reductase family protein [Deltaproteobacteria bacterium]